MVNITCYKCRLGLLPVTEDTTAARLMRTEIFSDKETFAEIYDPF